MYEMEGDHILSNIYICLAYSCITIFPFLLMELWFFFTQELSSSNKLLKNPHQRFSNQAMWWAKQDGNSLRVWDKFFLWGHHVFHSLFKGGKNLWGYGDLKPNRLSHVVENVTLPQREARPGAAAILDSVTTRRRGAAGPAVIPMHFFEHICMCVKAQWKNIW